CPSLSLDRMILAGPSGVLVANSAGCLEAVFTGVGSINAARSVFTLLTLQALDVLTVALDFGLVPVDLLLLPIIGVLMALQLVADQGASTESQTTADGGSSSGMAAGSTDESARGCAAESANTTALLACA